MFSKLLVTILFACVPIAWSWTNSFELKGYVIEEYIEPEDVVSQFVNEMNAYCEGEYNPDNQYAVEDDILTSPNADLANDIPGKENEKYPAGDYLLSLKTNKIKVYYADFKIFNCLFNGQETLGAIVEKTIRLPNGTKRNREEFLELKKVNNSYRIASISSDLFPKSYRSISCQGNNTTSSMPSTQKCELLKLANQAYRRQKYAEALRYYSNALNCQSIDEAFINNRIMELDTRNKLALYFQEAEQYFDEQEYEKALQRYQLIIENETVSSFNPSEINTKINLCQAFINYESAIEKADFFYKKGLFDKALKHYQTALRWQSNDTRTIARIKLCNQKIGQNYLQDIKKEIATANNNLSRNKKIIESAIVLMKYEKSGLLTGKQYFYLAQVSDSEAGKFKKKFNLSNKDCCVLSRRFMLRAREKGYQSEHFEDMWHEHFNENSRKCK